MFFYDISLSEDKSISQTQHLIHFWPYSFSSLNGNSVVINNKWKIESIAIASKIRLP